MSLLLLLGGSGPQPPPDVSPTLTYEIAFGYTWADTAPVWTDVTDHVEWDATTTIDRGRSAALDSFQTGSARFSLRNDGRLFDPQHSAGDYYGQLLPNVPVRIRSRFDGITYDLFRGFVDGWPQAYTIGNRIATVDVSASDAFKLFSQLDLVSGFFTLDSATMGVFDEDRLGGTGISDEEMSDTRIGTLLDLANWPSTYRDIGTGATLCQGQATDGSALAALQVVEKSEDGFVYIEADGDVTFVGRLERQTTTRLNTSQVTFSDADEDYPYQDLRYRYDDQLIYNDVRRTRDGGAEQSVEDPPSIVAYFRKTNSETGLCMATDTIARDIATVVLQRYKEPQLRIDSLVVDPGNNRTNLYPEVLGRRILDRVTVIRTPQETGSAITQELLIQGIHHQFSLGNWQTTFYVTPTDSFEFFTLDSATLGELDVDVLGG